MTFADLVIKGCSRETQVEVEVEEQIQAFYCECKDDLDVSHEAYLRVKEVVMR